MSGRVMRVSFMSIALGWAVTFGVGPARATYPSCPQAHPGHEHRLESLVKNGDSKMVRSAAGHAVTYAVIRYGIKDIVTEADKTRAAGEMYNFICWKLGSPSAAAAQWLTAGYQHFDRAYVDEAAAALLGTDLPGPGGSVQLPKALSTFLKHLADSLATKGDSTGGGGWCKAVGGDSTMWGLGCQALLPIVLKSLHQAIDRIGFNVGGVLGKFDVSDEQIALMIAARRNPVMSKTSPPVSLGRKLGGTIKR